MNKYESTLCKFVQNLHDSLPGGDLVNGIKLNRKKLYFLFFITKYVIYGYIPLCKEFLQHCTLFFIDLPALTTEKIMNNFHLRFKNCY